MIGVWHLILAFVLGGVIAESSGFLFAYMVFKTKREPYETMFKQPEQSETFLTPPYDQIAPPPTDENLPGPTAKAHERFMDGVFGATFADQTGAGPEHPPGSKYDD